ncbi:probable cytosolic oligopeptidase A isoform X2 [Zootermopsis nevadensis]|uniref:probable cytosolic oligopeptidase A isoform X2 n=1 Tax=Zootermopsis nevadensis TaxID=136037 RepID=UPI000B8E8ED0|nr:probable cytosolic oligopeptidase A isoform X2 [Zootermopsis nevadensis]
MAVSFTGRRIICIKNNFLLTPCRSGYIILLPEVPTDVPDDPLLKTQGIPEISSLSTEKCSNAVKKYALNFESAIWKIEDQLKGNPAQNLFAEVLDPLEKHGAPLDTTWGLVKTLFFTNKNLMPGRTYVNIHDKARRFRAIKFNSKPVYTACKEASLNNDFTEEQKRVVGKYILEGRLNGLDLDHVQYINLQQTIKQITNQRTKFKYNIDMATKKFQHTIFDHSVVREFPESVLKMLALDSSQPNLGPWKVTLIPHVYSKFLEYCPDRDLRWNMWQAYTRRASKFSDSTLQNSTHLEELRYHRRYQASLLGFDSFAAMSMETKMAGSVENVKTMITSLLARARPSQDREILELQEFAISRGFDGAMQLWDVPYWKRKQYTSLFGEKQLREYFPLPKVLAGLFTLCEQLFGVHIQERKGVSTWHPDVQYFDILEPDSTEPVAGFYFDPYARNDKLWTYQDAGWVIALRGRSSAVNTTPLASLIFNLPQPQEGQPALLSISDLHLLFKKFGHALQHLLTRTSYLEVSGLSNVEWDAIEVCSNFMVHWLYNQNTIDLISGHVETGDPLPSSMMQQLCLGQKHMAGYELCRELYLASLDLELHTSKDFWWDLVKKLWPQYLAFPLDSKDSHPCSFAAIFCEEWGAAYYCHLWGRVIAADVFSTFLEAELHSTEDRSAVGRRFRSTFLALGGSCHPGEVFRRFRGRDPSPRALLSSLGLKQYGVSDTPNTKK